MTKANVTMPIGSARLGSEHSACLSWCEASLRKKYNGLLPKTWRVYAMASAFCVFREGGGTVLKR